MVCRSMTAITVADVDCVDAVDVDHGEGGGSEADRTRLAGVTKVKGETRLCQGGKPEAVTFWIPVSNLVVWQLLMLMM